MWLSMWCVACYIMYVFCAIPCSLATRLFLVGNPWDPRYANIHDVFLFPLPWLEKKKKNNSMNWKLSKNFLLQFHQIMSMLLIVRVEVTHKLKVLQWWNENHTKKRESRSWDCEWFIVLINIKLCPLYSESRVAGNHNRNNKLSI